jgi:peptidyl-prolyl cis-trans isomerase SurA
MKKYGVWLVAASLALASVPARAQEPQPAPKTPQQRGTILQKIIVKVNGEIFTQTDLEEQQILAIGEKDPKLAENDTALQAALAEITPQLLVDAVDELLLIQSARETGARFTDENFKLALENVKEQNKLDDAGLAKVLAQQGMTMAQLRANFEKVYYVQIARQEIMRNMTLTEQESRQYYAKHPEQFLKPATMTVREIFVEVPTTKGADGQPAVSAAALESAQEKIAAARERVLKGEDFAKVAAEVSDSGSKANGGLIGTVLVSDLNPALREVFEKLEPGQVSEPLRTANGYQIFKLDARSAAEPRPFETVRNEIAQRIYDERLTGEMEAYLTKLREVALIEWRDPAYKEMYEKKRAELAAASGKTAAGTGRGGE